MQRPRPEPEAEPEDGDQEAEEEPEEAAAGPASQPGIQRSTFGEGGEKYDLKTSSIMSDTAFASLPLSAQTLAARSSSDVPSACRLPQPPLCLTPAHPSCA